MNTPKASIRAQDPGITPVLIPLKSEVTDIFGVSEPDAVGTLDIDESFTVIGCGTPATYRRVFSRYLHQVSGGTLSFAPVFSDRFFAYGQTRRFVTLDFKSKKVLDLMGGKDMDENIAGVFGLDGTGINFLVQVHRLEEEPVDGRMPEQRILRIVRVETGSEALRIVAEKTIATGEDLIQSPPWDFAQGTIFYYDQERLTLHSLDANLRQMQHPLTTLFNDNRKKFRRLDRIAVHPVLPMAFLVETDLTARDNFVIWVAYWKTDERKMVPIAGLLQPIVCTSLKISPSGDWAVYGDESDPRAESPMFHAIPIMKESPVFTGQTRKLGTIMRNGASLQISNAIVFTTKPESFVINDGLVLYKWDLGKVPREFKTK